MWLILRTEDRISITTQIDSRRSLENLFASPIKKGRTSEVRSREAEAVSVQHNCILYIHGDALERIQYHQEQSLSNQRVSGVYRWRIMCLFTLCVCLFTGAAAPWGSTQQDEHKKNVWVYMRVQHIRMQHRVFVWVYMNKHIPTFCVICFIPSSLASNPAEVHWRAIDTC